MNIDSDIVDAQGMYMLPGLIDAHGHIMSYGLTRLQVDLTHAQSIADLVRLLQVCSSLHIYNYIYIYIYIDLLYFIYYIYNIYIYIYMYVCMYIILPLYVYAYITRL
jgi:hypothetical protein